MQLNRKVTRRFKEPVTVRRRLLANGSQSLYLDIYFRGERSYEFLKLYLLPEVNNNVKEQNRNTLMAAETLKSKKIIELTNSHVGITIKGEWRKKVLAEWIKEYIDSKNAVHDKGVPKLRSFLNIFILFDKARHTRMGDIDKAWAIGFISWLEQEYVSFKGKPLAKGTLIYYISVMSIVLNAAVRARLLHDNPFRQLSASEKIRKPRNSMEFLTVEELTALSRTPCRSHLVKQAYLFSCYSGLRISDILRLRSSNIIDNNGNTMVSIVMKKTSTPVYIPLSHNACLWLPKPESEDDDPHLFSSLPTLTTINNILASWVRRAGIDKHITYHTSRHTFGTLMITAGADLYTTSKLMGHSDVRTTQIYARIVDSKKIEAIHKLNALLQS